MTGVYGWLTVNYLLGKLPPGTPYGLTGTVGALDLGGASTQITFKPSDPDVLATLYNVQLGDAVQENVATHSHLYFGANEARRRADQAALYQAWTTGVLPAPAVANSPCYSPGLNYSYVDIVRGASTSINGTGSFDACRASILGSLLDKGAQCLTAPKPSSPPSVTTRYRGRALAPSVAPTPPPAINVDPTLARGSCSIGGVYQPPVSGVTFVGFSSFSFLWQFLNLPTNGTDLDQIASLGRTLCATPWAELRNAHRSVPASFLQGYCFLSALTVALLVDGYGFPSNDTRILTVATPDSPYGWALGSMLFDANSEPWSVDPTPTPSVDSIDYRSAFFGSISVAAILAAALVAAACMLWSKRRSADGEADTSSLFSGPKARAHTSSTLNPINAASSP